MAANIVRQNTPKTVYATTVNAPVTPSADGNTLALVVLHQSGSDLTVSDSAGNPYTLARDTADVITSGSAGAQYKVGVYYCIGAKSASSVTVTQAETKNRALAVAVYELSGVTALGPAGAVFYSTTSNNFTLAPAGPKVAPQGSAVILSAAAFYDAADGATLGSPFTLDSPLGLSTVRAATGHAVVSDSAIYQPSFLLPSDAANAVAVLAVSFTAATPISAAFSATPQQNTLGVRFDDASTPSGSVTSRRWSFGDGSADVVDGSAAGRTVTLDAIGTRALEDQRRPADWAKKNGVNLIFGEIGIPANIDGSKYDSRYDDALTGWLETAKSLGIPFLAWGSAEWPMDLRAYSPSSTWSTTGDLAYATSVAKVIEPYLGYHPLNGVNLSGAEFSEDGQKLAVVPGTYGTHYYIPSAASVAYLASRGHKAIRVPIRWERFQHGLGVPFDEDEVRRFTVFLDACKANGIIAIVDLHNYGGVTLATGEEPYLLGQDAPAGSPDGIDTIVDAFVAFWDQFARKFGTHPGLGGFGLMNEPHDLIGPSGTTKDGGDTWRDASERAGNAIVAITHGTKLILVSGYFYATASGWVDQNGQTPWLYNYPPGVDHALSNEPYVYFEVHMYLDDPHGGKYDVDYATNLAQATSDDQAAGVPTSRNITIGASASSTLHTFAREGTFTVTLTVQNAAGSSSRTSRQVVAQWPTLPVGVWDGKKTTVGLVRRWDGSTQVNLSHHVWPAVSGTTVVPTGTGYTSYSSLTQKDTFYATVNGGPANTAMTFTPGRYEVSDFMMTSHRDQSQASSAGYGLGFYFANGSTGVYGSGIDKTVFEMVPHSSTVANEVPPDSYSSSGNYLGAGTNQLQLFRVNTGAVTLSGFTVAGTDQGHNYNGVILDHSDTAVIDHVKVTGIPGTASVNPGETFSLNVYQSNSVRISNLEVDGRRDGIPVAASGVGVNGSKDTRFTDCYFHDVKYGSGITFYQCTDPLLTRVKVRNPGPDAPCINFERTTGTAELRNVDVQRGSRKAHVWVASDTGSCTLNIYDPVYDGDAFVVRVTPTYQGNPGVQDRSAVHLYVDGRERPDLLTIV